VLHRIDVRALGLGDDALDPVGPVDELTGGDRIHAKILHRRAYAGMEVE
jgi:hypothetical protein